MGAGAPARHCAFTWPEKRTPVLSEELSVGGGEPALRNSCAHVIPLGCNLLFGPGRTIYHLTTKSATDSRLRVVGIWNVGLN